MASDGEVSCANDPNFAVIYSFLKAFGELYGLEVPSLVKLQESIDDTQEVSECLKELHLRLLRRALKSAQSNRWERCLIKFCHQQSYHQEAWEIERFTYKKASTQVKLKVLKLLLEYQFTCHPKFKTAVNAIACKELRLDPIGRDKNGCVYWLQIDHEANLCLYQEDQDEETWQLVARNRDELVKVISQLKKGEDIIPVHPTNNIEDIGSGDLKSDPDPDILNEAPKDENIEGVNNDNEEEFLSPESESDHDNDEKSNNVSLLVQSEKEQSPDKEETRKNLDHSGEIESNKECKIDLENKQIQKEAEENSETSADEEQNTESKEEIANDETIIDENPEKDLEVQVNRIESHENIENKTPSDTETEEREVSSVFNKEIQEETNNKSSEQQPEESTEKSNELTEESKSDEEFSETIEEPVMVVTGEGNGADCESSYIIGEEITEEVMYFFGDGYGYDNDTGNPEVIEKNSDPEQTDEENVSEEHINGEHPTELNTSKNVKGFKLKNRSSVTKRSLKKQSNDTAEVLNVDSKKHCVRDMDKSEGSKSNGKNLLNESKLDGDNDKSDSESPRNTIKKSRGKVKKKMSIKKIKFKDSKEVINSVSETDNCHDSKSSIIEKRKSSVSSEHDKDSENDKEDSPEKDLKVEDQLPSKKLRLEPTPDKDETHSKDNVTDSVDNGNEDILDQPISQRKKIKANKSKLKVKKVIKDNIVDKEAEKNDSGDKKGSKSLKRSLLDATMSDKIKSESQSENEGEQQMTSRKRLKIKPKKVIMSSRKKVEAKLRDKHSSDESEEDETLYSLASKRPTKKLKKKPKEKDKKENVLKDKKGAKKGPGSQCDDDDSAPVRQSRRIAQMKIKEEAERRHIEEVALREMKMIHKKKSKDDEEEWKASGCSSGSEGGKRGRGRPREWRSESTGPEPDSDSEEPLFEEPRHHEEPDLDYNKSDHEFSPESDLESDSPAEPLKRARTLQEEKDDGFCKSCGSAEQPEWILLCDKCDAGYHASCLKPMLFLVPEGNWYCPPCSHELLIEALEKELVKYDELVERVEAERAKRKQMEPEGKEESEAEDKAKSASSESGSTSDSSSSSSSSSGAVYRLRARKQAPVSYRAQEYDRLISSAIKEEYVEPTTSAGNQGRGKDISTIIEAAEEEKLKAEREALEQGKPVEFKKMRKKQRRKPRKLNSLDVPSEDDDETDEDFKDTGLETSSEEISSSADRDSSNDSRSSDSLPIRRTCRSENKKERTKIVESSPEAKKKKGVFEDSSSESAGAKDWTKSTKKKSKHSKHAKHAKSSHKKRDKSSKKRRKRSGLTQYDAEGNVIRARVTYGGLSEEGENDWSPKHRTRQKKINYTEMPNTESEDEMHKSSGKHMPDSSDEFKLSESELSSDSEYEKAKRAKAEKEAEEGAGVGAVAEAEADGEQDEERRKAISEALAKASSAVVPLEKLPEEFAKAHLEAKAATNARAHRGRGSRGGRSRGGRGGRGGGGAGAAGAAKSSAPCDEALARLVGVKIKDLSEDGPPIKPNQLDREKKRQEREAKLAEKEARKLERLQKKEEKEKLKEMKAKEREEKRLARLALQESKRMKKEKPEYGGNMGSFGPGGDMRMNMYGNAPVPIRHPGDFQEQRFPATPRLQVRAELRGVMSVEERMAQAPHPPEFPPNVMREGTLSVAGSPQPFKPVSEEPSIITRMPHMLNQQYRGPMMYPGGANYGPRPPQGMPMYPLHAPRHQYAPQGYYPPHTSALPPGYPPRGPHATPPHSNGGPHPPSPHMGPRPPGMPPNAMPYRPPGVPPPGYGHRPGPSFSGAPSPRPTMPPTSSPLPIRPGGLPPGGPMPSMTPPAQMSTPPGEPPVKIKAEVKTEPEYRSPVGSPSTSPAPPMSPGAMPREEPPRHPKIKVTENKDRRPRYPLGPYAPQYGPYGPYAPGPGPPERNPAPEHFPRGPPPHRYHPPELRPPSPANRHPTPPFDRPPPEGAAPLVMTPPPRPPHPTPPPAARPPGPPAMSRPSPSPLESAPPSYLSAQLRASPRPPFGGMMPPRLPPDAPSQFGAPRYPAGPRHPLGGYRPGLPLRNPVPPRLERVPSPARLETLGDGVGVAGESVPVSVRRVATPEALPIKVEAPEQPDGEEGGVFGGLVSYFSSQREDDLDSSM